MLFTASLLRHGLEAERMKIRRVYSSAEAARESVAVLLYPANVLGYRSIGG